MKRAKPRHDADCVAACLASVLELPITKLPDFWNPHEDQRAGKQYDATRRYLATRGYHWYFATCEAQQFRAFQSKRTEQGCSWPPRGYWFARITRVEWLIDDEAAHCVVMHGRKCVYNPSGSLAQAKEDDVFIIGYYLLVPLDPA